jgi:hypothetical protein
LGDLFPKNQHKLQRKDLDFDCPKSNIETGNFDFFPKFTIWVTYSLLFQSYIIQVELGQNKWKIFRRYSQFVELDQQVGSIDKWITPKYPQHKVTFSSLALVTTTINEYHKNDQLAS